MYRVIVKAVRPGGNPEIIEAAFKKNTRLPANKIHYLLKLKIPLIVWTSASLQKIYKLQETLFNIGCDVEVEQLIDDRNSPFPITVKNFKFLDKELKKAARSKTNLALMLIRPLPKSSTHQILPMIGPIERKLETYVHESDTVLALDESRMLVIGYSTDVAGSEDLKSKLTSAVSAIFKNNAFVSLGCSNFPEDGRNLGELLVLAESRRNENEKEIRNQKGNAVKKRKTEAAPDQRDKKLGFLELVFREARGRQFQRLLSLDAGLLYSALNRLDPVEQRKFLNRVTYNSELASIYRLSGKNRPKCAKSADSFRKIREAVEPAVFQKELEVRKEYNKSVYSKLEDLKSLPTLPEIAMQVYELAANSSVSISEVARLVSTDPALSSKLLQIVNSPFYGFIEKVSDVRRAIGLLGLDEVVDISLGLATANIFKASKINQIYNPRYIWLHSMNVAYIAQSLCDDYSRAKKKPIFTISLLHDIGKIFLADNFIYEYKDIHENSLRFNIPLHELEEEVFGTNHAQIGMHIAARWNYPDKMAGIIGYHHQPYENDKDPLTTALVGLADHLSGMAAELSEKNSEEPVFYSDMSFGHWDLMTRAWKSFDERKLNKLAEKYLKTIEDNKRFFDSF